MVNCMGTFIDNTSRVSQSAVTVSSDLLFAQLLYAQRIYLLNRVAPDQAGDLDTRNATAKSRLPWLYGVYLSSINDVCAVLNSWGEYALSDRMSYLASDEDLEEGEVPATLESARAFLGFFGAVESEGRVDLACSPDGEISAVWRFPDEQRRACVWFLDTNRVTFAATNAEGKFIRVNSDRDASNPSVILEELVQAGLLKWYKMATGSSCPSAMLLDIVASAEWYKMASPWRRPFYSETTRATYPPTGWSTSTTTIDHFSLPASASR